MAGLDLIAALGAAWFAGVAIRMGFRQLREQLKERRRQCMCGRPQCIYKGLAPHPLPSARTVSR